MIKNLPIVLALILLFTILVSSCSSTKKSIYFSDLDTVQRRQIAAAEFVEPLIHSDDLLSVNIQTIDPSATAPVNQNTGNSSAGAGQDQVVVTGFLVDRDGNIEIPILGIIKVAGLTTAEAKEVIRTRASKFYKRPTIQVRFANYKITVLGEVAKPASYTVPNEKISVLDAISLAGDLTIYGKRNNVMLIREQGNYKDVVRLDLNSSTLMASPFFYLKQNDVLYIEPTKAKTSVNNAPKNQMITIAIAVATLIVTAFRF